MIVKPAMMQATIQRTQDMSSIKQQEDNKAYAAQTNAQTNVQKDVQQKTQNVNKKENAEHHEEKHDAKEKGKNEYFSQNNKRDRNQKDESDGKVIIKKRANFDLKV